METFYSSLMAAIVMQPVRGLADLRIAIRGSVTCFVGRRDHGIAAYGVRREKAALSSGCKPTRQPLQPEAPEGRYHGGNEVAEAFGIACHDIR